MFGVKDEVICNDICQTGTFKVSEIEAAPESELEDQETVVKGDNFSLTDDDINVHILKDLEEDMWDTEMIRNIIFKTSFIIIMGANFRGAENQLSAYGLLFCY